MGAPTQATYILLMRLLLLIQGDPATSDWPTTAVLCSDSFDSAVRVVEAWAWLKRREISCLPNQGNLVPAKSGRSRACQIRDILGSFGAAIAGCYVGSTYLGRPTVGGLPNMGCLTGPSLPPHARERRLGGSALGDCLESALPTIRR